MGTAIDASTVSVTRGGSLPNLGLRVVPLQQMAPRRAISTTSAYSMQ